MAKPVYPNWESGMEMVLSLLSQVSVVSTSEPLPAKTQSGSSQIIRIHLAEPDEGQANHCNSESWEHLPRAA